MKRLRCLQVASSCLLMLGAALGSEASSKDIEARRERLEARIAAKRARLESLGKGPGVLGAPQRSPASPARATNTENEGVVTRDVGPEIGINFSNDGFLIHPQDPRQVLAATPGSGISKSRNGGHTWFRSNAGFVDDAGVLASVTFGLRADPRNPSTVYVVGDSGVYRSTDFGDTWSRLGDAEFQLSELIVDVAAHPTEPGVLFALSDTPFPSSALFRSTDGGVTFEPFGDLPLDLPLESFGYLNLVIVPTDPTTMYVAQELFQEGVWGLYKSTDGGAHWTQLPDAPPLPLQVFPHTTEPNTLYLQAFAGSTGLFKSTDGGATFEELTGGLPDQKVTFMELDPRRPSDVYAGFNGGLFRSTDGGGSFARLGLEPEQVGRFVLTFSVDPTDSRVIYVNTDEGNFKSVNGGRRFFPISRGWTVADVRAIAFDHRPNPRLLVATQDPVGGRLLRTANRGSHYTDITNGLPRPIFIDAIAGSVSDPDLLVIATNRGIFRSPDGGRSWTAALVDTGQTSFTFGRIAIDPTDAANVYVTCFREPSPGFYRSRDGGRTFTRALVLPGAVGASGVAVDPQHPDTIFVGARVGRTAPGLYKSTDGGETFTASLPTRASDIRQIVVDPVNTQNVYLVDFAFDYKLLRSTDGGGTFVRAQTGLEGFLLNGVLMDPQDPSTLFAWMIEGGLFATHDGGASWTLLDGNEALLRSSIESTSGMNAMAIDPKHPRRIYLGGASVLEVKIR